MRGEITLFPCTDDTQFFQMMTYRRVLEFLNLEKATIDYLKVDVEYSEVKMFNNIFREYPELLANVKQIGMEIHPSEVSSSTIAS